MGQADTPGFGKPDALELGTYFKEALVDQLIQEVGLKISGQSSRERLWRDLETTTEVIRHIEVEDLRPPLKQHKEHLQKSQKAAQQLWDLVTPDSDGKLSYQLNKTLREGFRKEMPGLDYDKTIVGGIKFLNTVLKAGIAELERPILDNSPQYAPDLALGVLAEIYERTFDKKPTIVRAEGSNGGPWITFMRLCLPSLLAKPGSMEKHVLISRWERLPPEFKNRLQFSKENGL